MANPQSSATDSVEDFTRRKLEELRAEVRCLEKVLEHLHAAQAASTRNEVWDLPPVAPGQYAGMLTGPALEAYLKARPKFKIPVERVAEDLVIGGAKLAETPQRHVQNVKITVRASPKLAMCDENWNIWLADTASAPPPPRNQRKKRKEVLKIPETRILSTTGE